MSKQISAFKIKVGGKILDYREGQELNLDEIRAFFTKHYTVKKIWSGGRHVLGVLEKSGGEFFLKLATSEGISIVTKNEFNWNEKFNNHIKRTSSDFWVPLNCDAGYYQNNLFYLITDRLKGDFLTVRPGKAHVSDIFIENIPKIIAFSELITNLNLKNLGINQKANYIDYFKNKAKSWLVSLPDVVVSEYRLAEVFQSIKSEAERLKISTRHGDFAPWHLIRLRSGQLALIDGEHAMSNGVELYDIGYLIQRVYSVMKNPELAERIVNLLKENRCDLSKLKIILRARAIGGFLDEFLGSGDYFYSGRFKNWLENI